MMFSLPDEGSTKLLLNTLALPVYAAGVSGVFLVAQLVLQSESLQTFRAKKFGSYPRSIPENNSLEDPIAAHEDRVTFSQHVGQLGGPVIFAYRIARFLACLALLCSSILERQIDAPAVTPRSVWFDIGLCAVYSYASLLALASVSAKPRFARLVTRHLVLLLLVVWAVYVYRDVWPLATFTLTPADTAEAGWFWAKFAILTFAAAVVPLFVPRQYIPVNQKEPSAVPAEEQTASILSMMLFSWMDHTFQAAHSIPHLPLEQFPRMADYDYAKNLASRGFPYLDPFQVKKDEHLFWGFMRVFYAEYVTMSLLLLLRPFLSVLSPVVINRVLYYLETGGADAFIRPWFWISLLFLGPMLGCIVLQMYSFYSARLWVHAEAIITQLVFDHALRMRVKTETSDTPPTGSSASTTAATPGTAPTVGSTVAHESQDGSSSNDEIAGSGTGAGATKGKQITSPSEGTDVMATKTTNAAAEAKEKNMVGRLNNLITADLVNIVSGCDFLTIFIAIPLQILLCTYFLYIVLGWSAFVGMTVMVVLTPITGFLAKHLKGVQVQKMKKTDARVQAVTEVMGVIRMIKLFGWEPRVAEQILEKREEELAWHKKFKFLDANYVNITHLIPLVTTVVTFATFTVIQNGELTASRVFSSMAVMEILRGEFQRGFRMTSGLVQSKVSLDRLHDFLHKTELLDKVTASKNSQSQFDPIGSMPHVESDVIGFREATFSWTGDSFPIPGSQQRNFLLRVEEELTFKHGKINLIVGPTGSGKTSLLMALLGEMHYMPSSPTSFFNLPRGGGLAYAAQESWVQSETIRDNILFGAPYDEERYNKVIEQCALTHDLSLFEAGDKTEVGEKGLTLSGGQKARVTLARAVYSPAEILLLDDVMAALDVHTARWIFDQCFKGDLIRGRTVLLVTHNVALANPIADFVVSLGKDGRIQSQGSLSKAVAEDKDLSTELTKESKELEQEEIDVEEKSNTHGKLIVSEEISEGRVGWPAWKLFLTSTGGARPVVFWLMYFAAVTSVELSFTFQTWFLGVWAKQYENHSSGEVPVFFYLSLYGLLTLSAIIFYFISYIAFVSGTLRAARTLHNRLISSVLGATLRWLDTTPTSRIIARCTTDFQITDNTFSDRLRILSTYTLAMVMKLCTICVVSPFFILPGIIVTTTGIWVGGLYVRAQLSAQRETSNANAPRVEHFAAAMAGLTSIRAYGAEDVFRNELRDRTDRYTRGSRTLTNLYRWVSTRIQLLSAAFVTTLAAYLVYGREHDASNASRTGFTLSIAVTFSSMTLWWVLMYNEVQVQANSLERIQQYLTIEQEPKPTERGVPPAYWPASGNLRVENLSARYSADGPWVLHDISFEVESGERVGIVGRTGSGKSSLTLALLRLILTEGNVYYDSLPTSTMNLDSLRSNITIIPQLPELLSGTLRQNLDPFQQYDDAGLNDALRSAGLFAVQRETDEARITLDSQIAGGGNNLSVGQRQILALARAIVRQSKLLILDEATSAIDYETDTAIQTSLRNELAKDVTILTVAHRLQTIMDADKIIVLDAGRIVEFGPPSELLKNETGTLRALVESSQDKDMLYAMAKNASASVL